MYVCGLVVSIFVDFASYPGWLLANLTCAYFGYCWNYFTKQLCLKPALDGELPPVTAKKRWGPMLSMIFGVGITNLPSGADDQSKQWGPQMVTILRPNGLLWADPSMWGIAGPGKTMFSKLWNHESWGCTEITIDGQVDIQLMGWMEWIDIRLGQDFGAQVKHVLGGGGTVQRVLALHFRRSVAWHM